MSRQKLKRKLLDQLDALHKFTPPPTLVDDEFNSIWTTIESDLKRQNRTFADEGTTEEKAREEYRAIAERRVRLGLLLAEIGDKNNIKVSRRGDLSAPIVERARQVPGREQEVWDYYRKNPQAMAGIRAPIYEEKVVDFLLELAKVTDKTVTKEELFKEDEDEATRRRPDVAAAASRPLAADHVSWRRSNTSKPAPPDEIRLSWLQPREPCDEFHDVMCRLFLSKPLRSW